jgi:hypothetical protein
MAASLTFKSADFEAVYGWLEGEPSLAVEVWGLEDGRRAALLAYNDNPQDGFSWSNWAAADHEDPSQLAGLFEALALVAEPEASAKVSQAFPGVFTPGPTDS